MDDDELNEQGLFDDREREKANLRGLIRELADMLESAADRCRGPVRTMCVDLLARPDVVAARGRK